MKRAAALAVGVIACGAAGALAQAPQLAGRNNGKPVAIEAENGIEWQRNNSVYIARGHAKATRGDDSVLADTLYAFYRPTAQAQQAPAPTGKNGATDPLSGGATEIYRLEADGHVHFAGPTQTVDGDHAVYDVDSSVLVVTGKDLRLLTPRDVVTARDSLEWYDTQQMGVARGNALAVRGDRRVSADVLTMYVVKTADSGSHISRINANGNVIVTSADQIARGDDGVYNLDTGIATVVGHVRLTRGDNELRGRYGVVDLNNHVSRLLSQPPGAAVAGGPPPRVEGLLVPRQKPAETAK